MRTDRLDLLGLALLTASLALFSAASIARNVAAAPPDSPIDTDAATTVDIAIRARAEGRGAHADSLLASLAARNATISASKSGSDAESVLDDATRVWFPALALASGLSGVACVVQAAKRRRRTFDLLSAELGQPERSDDPGVLVVALYRLRAERAAAQSQLRKAQALLDQASNAARSAATRSPRPLAVDSSLSPSDSHAHPFHELGRIVEITPIDPECGHRDHPR